MLRARVEELELKLAAALAEIQRLRTGGGGNPAPFSRGQQKPAQDRKRPGRKPGQGRFTHRTRPDYSQCDVIDKTAPLGHHVCQECGEQLEWSYEEASTLGLPEVPRPRVQRFRVEVGRCRCCRKVYRGTHPDLRPDQYGATAHRVDNSVYAAAHWLHYGVGVPVRRVPMLLHHLLRLPLTQGAITQDALRRVGETRAPVALPPATDASAQASGTALVPTEAAPAAGPIGRLYLTLRVAIRSAVAVHTDDTGWRIAGQPAWLMVFCNVHLVVYQVRERHRNDEVREMLLDFSGIMICDRGSSYGSRHLEGWYQQKCLAHLIRNCKAVLDYLPETSRVKAEALIQLFREALALWQRLRDGECDDYEAERQRLLDTAAELLAPVSHVNPFLDRLLNGIGRQYERGHLFRFLDDPQIEPTNNRAERALRGAVIARKVSQCSRNAAGADAHAAWCSIIATLRCRGIADPVRSLIECMRTGELPEPEIPAPRAAGLPASC